MALFRSVAWVLSFAVVTPPGVGGDAGYGFGGIFIESSDGSCYSVNMHTEDCGCPSIYTPQLVLVTDGEDFDDRYRFLYICY